MYLDVHDDARAWKGYPRDVLDTLHQNGLITDPKTKAQSVVLTDVGLERAASVFQTLLAQRVGLARCPTNPNRQGTYRSCSVLEHFYISPLQLS